MSPCPRSSEDHPDLCGPLPHCIDDVYVSRLSEDVLPLLGHVEIPTIVITAPAEDKAVDGKEHTLQTPGSLFNSHTDRPSEQHHLNSRSNFRIEATEILNAEEVSTHHQEKMRRSRRLGKSAANDQDDVSASEEASASGETPASELERPAARRSTSRYADHEPQSTLPDIPSLVGSRRGSQRLNRRIAADDDDEGEEPPIRRPPPNLMGRRKGSQRLNRRIAADDDDDEEPETRRPNPSDPFVLIDNSRRPNTTNSPLPANQPAPETPSTGSHSSLKRPRSQNTTPRSALRRNDSTSPSGREPRRPRFGDDPVTQTHIVPRLPRSHYGKVEASTRAVREQEREEAEAAARTARRGEGYGEGEEEEEDDDDEEEVEGGRKQGKKKEKEEKKKRVMVGDASELIGQRVLRRRKDDDDNEDEDGGQFV